MLKKASPSSTVGKVIQIDPIENDVEDKLTPEKSPVGRRRKRPKAEAKDSTVKGEKTEVKDETVTSTNDEAKGEVEQQDEEAQPEKKIVPVITGEEGCAKLVEEGDCNPRAWTVEDVKMFLEMNDMPEPAKKLKVSGESLIKLNKEAVAVKVSLKTTLALMKLVAMLRRIDYAYIQKRTPPCPPPTPSLSPSFLSNFKIPKRKFAEPDVSPEQESKRLKLGEQQPPAVVDDDGWETVSAGTPVVVTPVAQPPSVPQNEDDWGSAPISVVTPVLTTRTSSGMSYGDYRGNGRGSGRGGGHGGSSSNSGVCFRCNKEGHFSRDCTEAGTGGSRRCGRDAGKQVCFKCYHEGHTSSECTKNGGGSGSGTGKASQVTPSSTSAPASADDDDWGSSATPSAISQKPPVIPEDGGDWGAAAPVTSSWDDKNTGSGRGSFGRGGRGGSGGGGTRTCYRCQQEGHISRDCPQGYGSGNANRGEGRGGGHGGNGSQDTSRPSSTAAEDDWGSSSTSTTSTPSYGNRGGFDRGGRGGGGSGGPRTCFRCQKEGHISRDCPLNAGGGGNRGGGSSGPRKCFDCNQEGHMNWACPQGSSNNSGGRRNSYQQQSVATPAATSSSKGDDDW